MSAWSRPTAGLARFAALHQLRVDADDGGESWFQGFGSLDASAAACDEVISGDWHGLPVRIARLRYNRSVYESTRKQRPRTEHITVAIGKLALDSPRMAISNRWFTEAAGKIFGFGSLPMTGERFIGHFQIEADRADYADQVLDAPMVEWLRTIPDLSLELDHGHVLVATQGAIDSERLKALLDALEGFVSRLPGCVWTTYGTAPNRDAAAA